MMIRVLTLPRLAPIDPQLLREKRDKPWHNMRRKAPKKKRGKRS
jgi:hypothetical protein